MIQLVDYYEKNNTIFASLIVGACFGEWREYPKHIFNQMIKDMKGTSGIILRLRKLNVAL